MAATPSNSPTAVTEIAVNLDDVTGEVLGDAQLKLLDAGALDVWTVPIGMKKQRPGVMLCVLCDSAKRAELARLMLRLTGSFGVRFRDWERLVLDRRHETVNTRFGDIRIKIGSLDGELVSAQPEFEDARELADRAGVPVRDVLRAAQAAADEWMQRQSFRGGGA
jgi:uncharacterized protein (DUF111 family)